MPDVPSRRTRRRTTRARPKKTSAARRARYARRRQRHLAGKDHDLASDQWAALVEAWGGCAYCATPTSEVSGSLQKDCVLPVSRGGRYTIHNVVPACRSCNASKGNDEVTGWLRRKRLDEERFLLRWREIDLGLDTAD